MREWRPGDHTVLSLCLLRIGRLLLIRCRVLPRLRVTGTSKTSSRKQVTDRRHNECKESPVRPTRLRSSHNDSLHVVRFLGPRSNDCSRACSRNPLPGNVASLPFRFVNGQQIVLAVSINHTGPYNFLLDSGTQSTMIDLLSRCGASCLILKARPWSRASDLVSLLP